MNRTEICGKKMADDCAFVDVQGFKANGGKTFVVKEFCLLHRDFVFHTIVRSPCQYNELFHGFRLKVDWLTQRYHGLPFDSGKMSIMQLVRRTLAHVTGGTPVIVKGDEKVEWVKQIYGNWCGGCVCIDCVNVEDYHPEFRLEPNPESEIEEICAYHSGLSELYVWNCHCALSNARQLRAFYLD